jgi:hypothetical protein
MMSSDDHPLLNPDKGLMQEFEEGKGSICELYDLDE